MEVACDPGCKAQCLELMHCKGRFLAREAFNWIMTQDAEGNVSCGSTARTTRARVPCGGVRRLLISRGKLWLIVGGLDNPWWQIGSIPQRNPSLGGGSGEGHSNKVKLGEHIHLFELLFIFHGKLFNSSKLLYVIRS